MILTRCPTCTTTFRVRPEQLRVRQGRVRCGHCSRPFNALESLVEDEALPIAAPTVEALPIGPALAEAPLAAAQPAPEPAAPAISPETPLLAPDFILDIEPQFSAVHAELAEMPAAEPAKPAGGVDAGAEEEHDPESAHGPLFVLEESIAEPQEQLALPETDEEVPELYVEGLSRNPAAPPAPDWSLPEWGSGSPASAAPQEISATLQPELAPPSESSAFALDFDIPGDELAPLQPAPSADAAHAEFSVEPSSEPFADDQGMPAAGGPEIDDWGDRHSFEEPASSEQRADRPALGDDSFEAGRASPAHADEALLAESPFAEAPASGTESIGDGIEAPRTAWPAIEAPPAEEPVYPFRVAAPAPQRNALWGLGIGTLLMLLLAQSALLFRNAMVQIVPESQPMYIELCARLGCAMALPREAGFIAIEATDLHPERARPDTFVLRTTIQNRAAFRQDYPHLELTLTDARDGALARRVVAPAEWRPAQAAAEGFAPGGVLEVSLPFEAPGLNAVGYRVYAFYP